MQIDSMTKAEMESVLDCVCNKLTSMLLEMGGPCTAREFEDKVRLQLRRELELRERAEQVEDAVVQRFPDITIGRYGVEVKYSTQDTWRSIANSVSEGTSGHDYDQIYLVFGKHGGQPEVRWAVYGDAIMHVRTSHVPRFEVEIGTQRSLFEQFGVEYEQFRRFPMHQKMQFIRRYARERLKPGERLWWLPEDEDQAAELAMELNVRLYTKLTMEEKRRMRAEAAVVSPQIVSSGRSRNKYDDLVQFLITTHGVLCHQARDLFSAGSVAERGPESLGKNYIARGLVDLEPELKVALKSLPLAVLREYWGVSGEPSDRRAHWLQMLDGFAKGWIPSATLFQDLRGRDETD